MRRAGGRRRHRRPRDRRVGAGLTGAPSAQNASVRVPVTQGFLFADLRGYTSFVERRGAAAAMALLARYRTVVRGAVERHSGAEIRTEGDGFYVVFPSASAAVACALDIVAAAAADAGDPLPVGVGVHAGEALESSEGPVGSAVNIAARLCAMAPAGEVYVSDTVRSLTRSVAAAAFVPVGRRRVKGLDEPLQVYRARPASVVSSGRRRSTDRRLVVPLAVAGLVVTLAGLALLLSWPRPLLSGAGTTGAPRLSPSATSTPRPVQATARTEFRSLRFAVPFTIRLGRGWERVGDETDVVAFQHAQDPGGWIDLVLVAAVLDPPCEGSEPEFIEEGPEHIIDWLATRPWLDHTAPRPYNIGPNRGRAVDIEVPTGDRAPCPHPGVVLFQLGGTQTDFGQSWGADNTERKRVIAIDVDGRTVTLAIGRPGDDEDIEAFWRLAEPLLQTIRFEAG